MVYGLVDAEELRDPFTFGPRADMPSQARPILIGVLWDAASPMAIIGDETVGVGDIVGAWTVAQILQNAIVIQRGERRESVSLGSPLPSD